MTSADTDLQAPAWRAHAAVLALGTFAVGTDAFVISGLLPDVSGSLRVSVGAAGQLVTVFSFAYAIAALVLGTLTAAWPRRTVLLTALAVFAAGNVLTALAPDYPLVLAARIVAAAGAAMYTASASATAAALAGEARRGRAIAIVIFGMTSSLVLGAPLGTLIGSSAGWRSTLWFVTALGLGAAAVLAWRLPAVGPGAAAGLRARLTFLTDRRILGVLGRTFLVFTGIYLPYTYLSAVFAPATHGGGDRLAVLLLVFGLAGTAGNLLAGQLADRYAPRRVVTVAAALLAVVFAVTTALEGSMAAAIPAVAVAGLLSFSITTPQQHELIALAPGAQSVVTSLYQSVLYLAVSLSGAVGAVGLHAVGRAALPWLAAGFVLAAALLTVRRGQI